MCCESVYETVTLCLPQVKTLHEGLVVFNEVDYSIIITQYNNQSSIEEALSHTVLNKIEEVYLVCKA